MKIRAYRTHSFFMVSAVLFVLAAGCNSKSATKCGPCPALAQMLPNLTFKVVDKTTNDDLFFGSKAIFKTSELKMHHIINGKPDTAFVRVDSLNQAFHVYIFPAHRADTVTMQIANKSPDILVFNTTVTGGCCAFLFLNNVLYNGAVVFTAANGPNVVVLAK
ncbi:hypothetical protein BH09BAC6_BH09BAC6_26600 [soil metagenome]|jgi:hypothetical protein